MALPAFLLPMLAGAALGGGGGDQTSVTSNNNLASQVNTTSVVTIDGYSDADSDGGQDLTAEAAAALYGAPQSSPLTSLGALDSLTGDAVNDPYTSGGVPVAQAGFANKAGVAVAAAAAIYFGYTYFKAA